MIKTFLTDLEKSYFVKIFSIENFKDKRSHLEKYMWFCYLKIYQHKQTYDKAPDNHENDKDSEKL